MSKKRGNKKNQDIDDELEEKKVNSHDITSKKGKGKKKGKGDDWSDEEKEAPAKVQLSDEEDVSKPVPKKSQKKGKHLFIMLTNEISWPVDISCMTCLIRIQNASCRELKNK